VHLFAVVQAIPLNPHSELPIGTFIDFQRSNRHHNRHQFSSIRGAGCKVLSLLLGPAICATHSPHDW
jgi:hypothetical protein